MVVCYADTNPSLFTFAELNFAEQNNLLLLGKDPTNLANLVSIMCRSSVVWFHFFTICVLIQTLKCESSKVFVEGYVVCKRGCTF